MRQPTAASTYIAHHHYTAEKEDELSLQVGDIISVSDMSDPGWWVGEKLHDGVKTGEAGWFPSNFVDPHQEPVADAALTAAVPVAESAEGAAAAPEESALPKPEGPFLARVEYDYEAKEPGELSLEAGRVVTILDSSDPAWWKGDSNGKIGTFPSNYVKTIEKKEDEAAGDKPQKFKLAAFGVKQGGLGSLFAGGIVPGLKKTGGLKKLGGIDTTSAPAPPAAVAPPVPSGSTSKRNSIDEPRSPAVSAPPSKVTPTVVEEVLAPAPAPVPAPAEQIVTSPEPRIPSRAKKPKSKQIKALVVYEYTAQEDDEISLAKGSTVVVTDKMGDEGWWAGRNNQGEVGNFPSDFVQEIKEEAVQSPSPSSTPVLPAPVAAVPVPQDEPIKSPVHARPPSHAAVALPAIPSEPLRPEPVRSKTDESPMATPPPPPRGTRPSSMIVSPSPQFHDSRSANDGPPLPGSPPPKRMAVSSRSNSNDYPASPRRTSAGNVEPPSPTFSTASADLSRSGTLRRPEKPIPEAPETDEARSEAASELTSDEAPTSTKSNRSSYILPTPVARTRTLPPLARPPSIHQITENRKSLSLPHTVHLPSVPGGVEDAHTHSETRGETHNESVIEEEEEDKPVVADVHVASPDPIHVEAEVHPNKPTEVEEEAVEDHAEEHHEEESHEHATTAAADEEAVVEEKEPEKPKLPEMESSGPVLSHASRPRPAKGRKPPSAPVPNPEASFVSQLEADVKAAPIVEERKPEPAAPVIEKAAPPPKPIKPIFQKFPTPFAGAQPASVALRPTGRRTTSANDSPVSPGAGGETSSAASLAGAAGAPTPGAAPPAGGVKSLSSRFGQFQGVPASGSNNSAALELEIAKLRRWMTEELDRVKKELADERESRVKLQETVEQLQAQMK
ncbi:SH3-domain kinase binding protein 1 [Dissophora globulifera]|uniref:SH3-domain kinase binding protein 1 n=1 Tax=Dissophora globulifera TaxID=979702 RepID=A0A9P6UZU2_9FUNG|nr:SH3-domain kinase binding protein 1 [Dissophora globulifera]